MSPASCDTSKSGSKDPGIAFMINVAETIEGGGSKWLLELAAAAAKQQQAKVKCAVLSGM